MREGTAFLLAALAVGMATTAATGQTAPAPNTPVVKLQGDVLYNSNVAGSSAEVAAQRGIARADTTYTPAAYVNYFRQLGADSVFLSGSAGYDFYQHNTILNRERLDGLGGFNAEIADCLGTVQGAYARHQSDLQDLNVQTTKNTEQNLTGSFNGSCNRTGFLVPSITVSQVWSTNSADQLFSSNFRSFSTLGSIMYKQPLLGDISLFGQYVETKFPHRLFLTPAGIEEDGYRMYAGGLKLDHHFGSRLDLLVSVSDTSIKSNSGISPDFNGVTYDGTLTYLIGARLTATLEASRLTTPANRLDAAYSVGEIYSFRVDYRLATELDLGLGASDSRQAYQGAALKPGVDITRESVKSFFATAGYNLSPDLSVNLGVYQDQRHADVVGYSYTSTRFSLSVAQAF